MADVQVKGDVVLQFEKRGILVLLLKDGNDLATLVITLCLFVKISTDTKQSIQVYIMILGRIQNNMVTSCHP